MAQKTFFCKIAKTKRKLQQFKAKMRVAIKRQVSNLLSVLFVCVLLTTL